MALNKTESSKKVTMEKKKQYMAWLEDPDLIKGPQEMTLTIRDIEPGRYKYTARNVIALISPIAIPDSDILRVRYVNGRLVSQPWSIKILKELPEFLPGNPYAGVVD